MSNTYTKGSKVKLSPNFSAKEFDCKGKNCCSTTIVDPKLVEYLQTIRDHFNAAITISSGYRCTKHNTNVGGSSKSQHVLGNAADIVVKGIDPETVAQYAETIGVTGIGLYNTDADGHFVHVDTRDKKSFWKGHAQIKVDTFQPYVQPQEKITAEDKATIMNMIESLVDFVIDIANRPN